MVVYFAETETRAGWGERIEKRFGLLNLIYPLHIQIEVSFRLFGAQDRDCFSSPASRSPPPPPPHTHTFLRDTLALYSPVVLVWL